MRIVFINLYMLIRHPILFFKYNLHKNSCNFLVNGSSRDIKTKRLNVGKNVRFGHGTRIGFFGEGKLQVGNDCYFVNYNSFLVGGDVKIGNNCLFASNILVTSENHEIEIENVRPYEKIICKPVVIGDGCWIGEKVVVLPGITIGNKCIIGAGSVVTKNVPDYSIVVGNPARIIKQYDVKQKKWLLQN